VQCATWGHPQTSGLPTIDYFLSSDLMEPEDGAAYYTETLVRLPNLSVSYTPLQTAPLTLDRARLSATEADTLYISCQSIFKYLPKYDFIFPRIALLAPRGKFLFICRTLDPARQRFEERLLLAFRDCGLDYTNHVVFCQPLPFDQFAGFLRMGDVFLDSIGWSGCNTTLEALDVDLPVVTLPIGAMRGRHSGAILEMMGVTQGIATSAEDYIVKAAALADPRLRQGYREQIRANKSRLFGDVTPIRALEDFLRDAVKRAYRETTISPPPVR
jgi:predicted O-linked N-acetylglucosamine transferase (SPINDLY family)